MRMRIVPHRRPKTSYRAVLVLLLTVVALPAAAGFTGTDVFIPASARSAGASSAQFYSTLWLTNLSLGSTANVQLQFFLHDTSNTAPITVPMAVAPGQTQKFENVVQTLFGLPSASGAIRILSDQEVLATSRTYNLPTGSDIRDANGLFFAGIPQSLSIGIGEATQLQGVSQGGAEDFRFNFGFVETAGSPVTVRIIVRNSDGSVIGTKDYAVQAYEPKQFPVTDAAPGISAVNARIDASVVSGSGRVLVYGTAIANGSNDSIGFEMSFRNALLSGGVTSLNGLTGVVSLAAGANVTLTPSGNTITIASTGGGGGGGGVPNVNGITGPVTLLAGTNMTITPSGGTLTFSSGAGLTLPFTGSAATSSSTGAFNVSTPGTSIFSSAIVGTVSSTSPGDSSAGVRGVNLGTGSLGIGVLGSQAGGGWGVYGQANGSGGYGVYGSNSPGIGVYGTSAGNVGVKGKSTNYNGVWAESTNQDGLFASGGRDGAYITGARFGAFGVTSASGTAADYAGVIGMDGSGVTWTGSSTLNGSAGVLGYGRSGVAGVTSAAGSWGVIGMKLNSPTSLGPFGVLGYSTYGVYSFGNMGASGTKPFVEPHPTDASKVIRYVALEGPEAGTYFRGKAVVQDGVATIEVPESFRIVTDTEGLTVHVTAVGRASQTWVASADLNRIVIGATPDVAINYIVHGVRKAYKDWQVIAENVEYVPMSAAATMPAVLSNEAKKRLIANGTYNPDGTVNMSTAENLGWARVWREQEQAQAKAEAPK